MNKLQSNKGFTLVEMIGVMAVIAILAGFAVPRVYEAIEDAKVTAVVQQIQSLKTATAEFYADTGRFPLYHSTNAAAGTGGNYYNQFMKKDSLNTSGADIPGWSGPYFDKMPEHPVTPKSLQYLIATNQAAYICDADGDGTTEGPWMLYRIDGLNVKLMEKISGIIDGDAGESDWGQAGLVKQYNDNSTSVMVVCFTRS